MRERKAKDFVPLKSIQRLWTFVKMNFFQAGLLSKMMFLLGFPSILFFLYPKLSCNSSRSWVGARACALSPTFLIQGWLHHKYMLSKKVALWCSGCTPARKVEGPNSIFGGRLTIFIWLSTLLSSLADETWQVEISLYIYKYSQLL